MLSETLPSQLLTVIEVEPVDNAVTNPSSETVATAVSVDDQTSASLFTLAGNNVADNCFVSPLFKLKSPSDKLIDVGPTYGSLAKPPIVIFTFSGTVLCIVDE